MKRWQWYLAAIVAAVLSAVAHPMYGMVLMAGATTLTTDIDEAMKVIWQDPIITNYVTDSELLDLFNANGDIKIDQTTGGRYIETAQIFTANGGYGYRAEDDYIPVADPAVVANGRILLKKGVGTVQMSGDVRRKVKGNPGAFADWAETEMPRLVERMNNEDDRIMIGFGAGAKSRIASGGISGNVITVDRAFGVTGLTNAVFQFMEGERLVCGPNLNGTSLRNTGTSARVTLVDLAAGTVTVDSIPNAWAQNDYLFSGDDAGVSTQTSGGDDREFMGLLGHVDDGTILSTYQNLVRATYGNKWKGNVIDGSASPFSGVLNEDCIVYADEQCDVIGGGKINAFIASRSGQRSFWKSLKTDRILNDPVKYQGGKSGLSMVLNDRVIEVRGARKMPAEIAFGLTTKNFVRHMLGSWEWDDTTGSVFRQVTTATGVKDAFYAYGHKYLQVSCSKPSANFKIKGLTAVT